MRKLVSLGLVLSPMSVFAAVPVAVTTAVTDAAVDAAAVAALALLVIIGVYAIKAIRKGL